jgi:hypothetical protein
MQRLNRFTPSNLSPAQRAVLNPAPYSSERAVVLSVSTAGLYQTVGTGIDRFKLTVECSERPGQPLELWGQASMARPLSQLKKGDVISFEGDVQGSIGRGRRPHVVVNRFDVIEA